jgi:hypothetical protein
VVRGACWTSHTCSAAWEYDQQIEWSPDLGEAGLKKRGTSMIDDEKLEREDSEQEVEGQSLGGIPASQPEDLEVIEGESTDKKSLKDKILLF